MSTDYPAGTVAKIDPIYGGRGYGETAIRTADARWHTGTYRYKDAQVGKVSPLIVLAAPEAAVAALRDALGAMDTGRSYGWIRALIHQIETQLAAMKPDEPMGFGAVVEDTDGLRWVRSPGSPDIYSWLAGPQLGGRSAYADISAVRVLSEGVKP